MILAWSWLSAKEKFTFAVISPGWMHWFRQQEHAEAVNCREGIVNVANSHASTPAGPTEISEAEVLYLQERQMESDLADQIFEEESRLRQQEMFMYEGGMNLLAALPFQSDSE